MLTLTICNVSGLAPVSDYVYAVYVGREQIASGTINGHTRDDGWAKLVKRVAEEHIKAGFIGSRARAISCGKVSRTGRVCVAIDTPGHTCKFVRIVPAKRPGVK